MASLLSGCLLLPQSRSSLNWSAGEQDTSCSCCVVGAKGGLEIPGGLDDEDEGVDGGAAGGTEGAAAGCAGARQASSGTKSSLASSVMSRYCPGWHSFSPFRMVHGMSSVPSSSASCRSRSDAYSSWFGAARVR